MNKDPSSLRETVRNRSVALGTEAASAGRPPLIGRVGHHRPVYFWGGPDTVRMNWLKFMGQPVNERVHLEAHTPKAARALAEAGLNWAYLMYNWGFPPEQDDAQRQSFREAVDVFHQAGVRVFGYLQLSNCVHAGSFRERDWYARDPQGRRIFYYTGRYITCWHHPEWREQLRQRVHVVVQAGADAVFLDNPWRGVPCAFVWMCTRCLCVTRAGDWDSG